MKINSFKSVIITLFVLTACSSSKQEKTAVQYNESLLAIVSKVDSLRLQIGDKEDESQKETENDLIAYRNGIKAGLAKLDSIKDFKGDTLFLHAAKNYLLVNRQLLKEHFVIIATVHDKIMTNTATEEEKAFAVLTNEELNTKLDSISSELQKSQDVFFRKNKLGFNKGKAGK